MTKEQAITKIAKALGTTFYWIESNPVMSKGVNEALDLYVNQEAIELIEFIRGIRVKEYSTNEEIYELFLKEKGGKE